MAVTQSKVWAPLEVLTASDLNAEFTNVYSNGESLAWPATTSKDMNAQSLILDADDDTHITADTDDRIDFACSGTDLFRFNGTATTPVNGLDFIAAAAGGTPSITANGTDTNIDINIIPQGSGVVTSNGTQLLPVENDDYHIAGIVYGR